MKRKIIWGRGAGGEDTGGGTRPAQQEGIQTNWGGRGGGKGSDTLRRRRYKRETVKNRPKSKIATTAASASCA